MTRAIIAGGGIVGLTTGRALLRAGMEVLVAEQADAIRAAGATLGLWGNAVSVEDILRNQVMVVPPLDRWVSRRVALIGEGRTIGRLPGRLPGCPG